MFLQIPKAFCHESNVFFIHCCIFRHRLFVEKTGHGLAFGVSGLIQSFPPNNWSKLLFAFDKPLGLVRFVVFTLLIKDDPMIPYDIEKIQFLWIEDSTKLKQVIFGFMKKFYYFKLNVTSSQRWRTLKERCDTHNQNRFFLWPSFPFSNAITCLYQISTNHLFD